MLERVFEPFFTTKEAGGGTGLGTGAGLRLRTSNRRYRLGRKPAGRREASVHILLPGGVFPARGVAGADIGQHMGRVHPAPAGEYACWWWRMTKQVAAVVVEMLGQLGHHPLHVNPVGAALGVLSGKHRVDLVFTDVLLPGGGSGLDLAREIARRELNVPVVLTMVRRWRDGAACGGERRSCASRIGSRR